MLTTMSPDNTGPAFAPTGIQGYRVRSPELETSESQGADRRGRPVRVVTWNVQGRAMRDAAEIAARVDSLGADIVCFQEIHRSQFTTIRTASALGHGEWWFKHWSIRYAPEGMATLSRWPVTPDPGSVTLTRPWHVVHYSRRIAGGLTVACPDGPLSVWNTHLSPDGPTARREAEVTKLLGLLPTERCLLAGDLNVRPGRAELAMFADAGWTDGYDLARPGVPVMTNLTDDRAQLKQRLDYILVSSDLADRVVDAWVPGASEPVDKAWWALSDHLPLVVDVDLAPAAAPAAEPG